MGWLTHKQMLLQIRNKIYIPVALKEKKCLNVSQQIAAPRKEVIVYVIGITKRKLRIELLV